MIDTHIHTSFSADSEEQPRTMIERAVSLGLSYLAVTDHQENETVYGSKWRQDFALYFETMTALKSEYKDRITLAIGVEMGYSPKCNDEAVALAARYPFDTIINSVHSIDGVDLYYETFYTGKTKRQAYEEYLRLVRDSINAPYNYTQLGHLGYIARYAGFDDRRMIIQEHRETADRLLRDLIDRDAVLELNASTSEGICATPYEFVKRYYELGGRRIAPASDAHTADKLARRYAELTQMAKEIGFKEYTFCLNGKKIGLPF